MAIVVAGLLLMPALPGKPLPIPYVDKIVHAILFFTLAFPAIWGLPRAWHWPVCGMVMVYGGATELVQPEFGRSAEWGDFIANALGAMLALGTARWVHSKTAKIQQRKRAKANNRPV